MDLKILRNYKVTHFIHVEVEKETLRDSLRATKMVSQCLGFHPTLRGQVETPFPRSLSKLAFLFTFEFY